MVVTGIAQGAAEVAGRPVVNFASASHLGLDVGRWLADESATAALPAWGLATGLPSSVASDAPTAGLEQDLAALVSAEAAVVGPSTLHLLLDAVAALAGRGTLVVPGRAYTLLATVADRVRGGGGTVIAFDPQRLGRLRSVLGTARPPVVILTTSIEYPGVAVPLRALVRLACATQAFLIVDDTLALGLWGHRAAGQRTGVGGGGALLWNGLRPSGPVLQVGSLTKGFGVPLAFAAGERRLIARIRRHGGVLVASSPADLVSVQAARWALRVNAAMGEALRSSLWQTVTLLREAGGLEGGSGELPVLSRHFPSRQQAEDAGALLLEDGIWGLLDLHPHGRQRGQAALRFNVSASHAGPLAARALAVFQQMNRRLRFRAAA